LYVRGEGEGSSVNRLNARWFGSQKRRKAVGGDTSDALLYTKVLQ
jgi:hypothetical protein